MKGMKLKYKFYLQISIISNIYNTNIQILNSFLMHISERGFERT